MGVQMRPLIAHSLVFLSAALLSANPALADQAYSRCVERTASNLEWAGCGEAYLKRLEVALSVSWKRTAASLDEESRKDLLQEQRAWLRFRDSSCMFWANGSFGRDGQVLHFFTCRADITQDRISDLNRVYEFMRSHR
jgi:uncharacterized protein YecT (DUF1311 family)